MAESEAAGVLIVLPTLGDRPEQLRLALKSIQTQTYPHWRCVIIGDGMSEDQAKAVSPLIAGDARMDLLRLAKSKRRGEPHRHDQIAAADPIRFPFVAYICDRDLWFPEHLEWAVEQLTEHPFGFYVAQGLGVTKKQEFWPMQNPCNVWSIPPPPRKPHPEASFPLSAVVHSRALYDQTTGWNTTPRAEKETDVFMWRKLLAVPEHRVCSTQLAGYLYFAKDEFGQAWSRHAEIASGLVAEMEIDAKGLRQQAFNQHIERTTILYRKWNRRWLLFYRGRHRILRKITWLFSPFS